MAPPSPVELARRPLFDAPPGSIHVKDLITLINRRKDFLSDNWVGVFVVSARLGFNTRIGTTASTGGHSKVAISPLSRSVDSEYNGGNGRHITNHRDFETLANALLFAGPGEHGHLSAVEEPRPFAVGDGLVWPDSEPTAWMGIPVAIANDQIGV